MAFEQYQTLLYESASKLPAGSRCPISLRPICRELGVRGIRRDKLNSGRSLLVDAGVSPVIILNTSLAGTGVSTDKFTRWERFLIAHEIGHLVLHQSGAKSPDGRTEYWKLEALCDAFARRLLIPESTVENALEQSQPMAVDRLRATLRVSEECSVPWSVAALRVAETSNPDTVFFRLARVPGNGLKVAVSARHNRRGIGQLIKPGMPLHERLHPLLALPLYQPREIEAHDLSGIGDIDAVQSGAACAIPSGMYLAAMPA